MIRRSELVDAAILLACGWAIVTARALAEDGVGWRAFGVGLASTSAWALVVGVALCEFTSAHAALSGVVGV